ncbi:unnamed protein product [Urochloa humidicola]
MLRLFVIQKPLVPARKQVKNGNQRTFRKNPQLKEVRKDQESVAAPCTLNNHWGSRPENTIVPLAKGCSQTFVFA